MDAPMRWEATPNAMKLALLRPETVADIRVMIASHRDLHLSEVIVPEIRLPYTTPYKTDRKFFAKGSTDEKTFESKIDTCFLYNKKGKFTEAGSIFWFICPWEQYD